MRVLVLGSGAREHALVARLAVDRDVGEIVAAPGNPGIARLARIGIRRSRRSPDAVLALADREQIDLTVVGPELPLSLGIADRFAHEGRLLFGPTAAAARLESSKAFAKAFMARHGVPTARFRTCESLDAGARVGARRRVRLSGRAEGGRPRGRQGRRDRGGSCRRPSRRSSAAMRDRKFGAAGDRLVIEECLHGPGSLVLRHLRRRARRADWHGAGSQADLRRGSRAEHRRHGRLRAEPAGRRGARGARHARDRPAGDRRDGRGRASVSRLSLRRPDADARPARRSSSSTSASAIRKRRSCCRSSTSRCCRCSWPARPGALQPGVGPHRSATASPASSSPRAAIPESSESGQPIAGVDDAEAIPGVAVYHAGTAQRDGQLVTAGGRVLTVVGRGDDFAEAIARAYAGVAQDLVRRHAVSPRHRAKGARSSKPDDEVRGDHVRLSREPGRLARLRGGAARRRRDARRRRKRRTW